MENVCKMRVNSWERDKKKRNHLGRRRCRWYDNITKNLKETRWERVDWIHLVEDRHKGLVLLNMVMSFRVSQYMGKFWLDEKLIDF
jgi:imidazole glycerol phosphate synthase subunit HisF